MIYFQVNFFLYAITGKAFRHELRRLFHSIAIKLHLSKDPIQKTIDRRTATFNNNRFAGELDSDHRLKRIRSSPITLKYFHWQKSFDLPVSDDSTVPQYFQQQKKLSLLTRKNVT